DVRSDPVSRPDWQRFCQSLGLPEALLLTQHSGERRLQYESKTPPVLKMADRLHRDPQPLFGADEIAGEHLDVTALECRVDVQNLELFDDRKRVVDALTRPVEVPEHRVQATAAGKRTPADHPVTSCILELVLAAPDHLVDGSGALVEDLHQADTYLRFLERVTAAAGVQQRELQVFLGIRVRAQRTVAKRHQLPCLRQREV